MKLLLYILLAIVGLCLVPGCGQSAFDADVARAEALMDTAPDSALAIAENLHPSGEGQQARAALLLLKARYKAYVPLTDDSLALIAANYFDGRNDSLAAQAYFFLGETYNTLGRKDKAIIAAKIGCDHAENVNDYYFAGLNQRLLSEIYFATFDFPNQLKYKEEALRSFTKAQKSAHVKWELLEYARILANQEKTDASLQVLDSLAKDTVSEHQEYHARFALVKATNYNDLKQYNDVIEAYHLVSDQQYLGIYDWWIKSFAYSNLHMYKEAAEAIDSTLQKATCKTDTIRVLMAKRVLARNLGDYNTAYNLYEKETSLLTSHMDSVLTHPYNALIAESALMQAQAKSTEATKTKHLLYIAITCCVLILIIATLTYFLTRKSIQLKNVRIENLFFRLKELEDAINDNSSEIAQLSGEKIEIIKKHIADINCICTEIFRLPISTELPQRTISTLKRVIAEFREFPMQGFLEHFVNYNYDGVMNLLRSEYNELSEKQLSLFRYYACGFSPEAIAVLTDAKSSNAVLTAKSRLKKIFTEGNTTNSSLFISILTTSTHK